jgi:hypothetical protein
LNFKLLGVAPSLGRGTRRGLELFAEVGVLCARLRGFWLRRRRGRGFFGELEDGFFPIDLMGLAVFEVELEDFDEAFGFGEVAV